jgi:hypothetical protein
MRMAETRKRPPRGSRLAKGAGGSGMQGIRNAVLTILVLAFGLRVAWTLIQPVVPTLAVLAFLLVVLNMLVGRRG